MITILLGLDAAKGASEWAKAVGNTLWFSYDEIKPLGKKIIYKPSYEAIATYAQRVRFPSRKSKDLIFTNLDAFRLSQPGQRSPLVEDFSNAQSLMQLCLDVAEKGDIYNGIVISSFSSLYDLILLRIGNGLSVDPLKIKEYGQALASEALTQLISDLNKAGKDICLVVHEVLVGNRLWLHMPKTIESYADLIGSYENGELNIIHSTWNGLRTDDKIDTHGWNFINEYRKI